MVTIGYDMYVVQPMNDAEQAAHNEAAERFHALVKVRDEIPKEEMGRRDRDKWREYGDQDDRTWIGRTERYSAAQKAVNAACIKMQRLDKSYFRLNIGGMSRYLHAMGLLGMLQDVAQPRPFPQGPDEVEDTFYEEAYAVKDDLAAGKTSDLPVRPEVLAYAQDVYNLLSWTPETITGMAYFKWDTNDGWHVLPAEITAALATYRQHNGDTVRAACEKAGVHDLDYWMAWIDYLIYAESHGGFRVS